MLLPRKRNRPKEILSHTVYGSCFCVERRDIFLLKKYEIQVPYFLSSSVNLLKRRTKANLHTENAVMFIVDKKKPKKKRLLSFLHMFSKVQHLKGLMKFGDN